MKMRTRTSVTPTASLTFQQATALDSRNCDLIAISKGACQATDARLFLPRRAIVSALNNTVSGIAGAFSHLCSSQPDAIGDDP